MAKAVSKIPRGFTRFYVLHLLTERPMTGKEIIDEAERRSDGAWKPSPGLIYPLLGRLVRGGLVKEGDGGRFIITPKGEATLRQYTAVHEQIEKQFNLVRQLGLSMLTTGRLLAEESLDRIMAVTSTVQEVVAKSSKDLQKSFYTKYRAFLESELRRLEGEQSEGSEKEQRPYVDESLPLS